MNSPKPKTQSTTDLQKEIIDAYTNLNRDQLVLFLSIRHLPSDGSSIDLANRLAKHDLETYKSSPLFQSFPAPPEISPEHPRTADMQSDPARIPNLPAELIAEIMDHVGDWELAKAVGTVTALRRPRDWTRASLVDEAALSGLLVRMRLAAPPSEPSTSTSTASTSLYSALTPVGANAIVRLGYVHILEHLRQRDRPTFDRLYGGPNYQVIPLRASASGRTDILSWWRSRNDIPKKYGVECLDEACRYGQLEVLEWWWRNSAPDHFHPANLKSANLKILPHPDSSSSPTPTPLYMLYTEAALENASARGNVHVLSWFMQKNQQNGLPLRIGRVMDLASKHGSTEALEWWRRSGIEVKYNNETAMEHASRSGKLNVLSWWLSSGYPMKVNEEVLITATRHNRPEVLQWFYDSGLEVSYRICDVEEAIEDAVRPGVEAREWWNRLGVDFKANNAEWMKQKNLRP